MPEQKIKIKNVDDSDTLKQEILNALKINDSKKNCLPEFERRVTEYLERNPGLMLNLVIDKKDVRLRMKQKTGHQVSPPRYPKGFSLGQPNMMWGMEMDTRSDAERDTINKRTEAEFKRFEHQLLRIIEIGKGQIKVTESN